MRHIITKAQVIGQKAAEFRQAMQNLPGQAAKIREAVTMTGGELHQLRSDVQSSINALRVDNEERLLKTMREVNDHASVFVEAGYSLNGVDLDLSLNQRLAVHLDKIEDVPHATLRGLLAKQSIESIRSILAGIIKAEETAANVELSALKYVGLVVHAGAIPMIRMHWREEQRMEPASTVSSGAASPEQASAPATTLQTGSFGSIFEPRPFPVAVQPATHASEKPVEALPPPTTSTRPAIGNAWSSDALERFKRMPGASKYGR